MSFQSNPKAWTRTTPDYRKPTNVQSLASERRFGTHGRPPIEQAIIPPRIKELEEVNKEPQETKRFPWMRSQVP